MKKLILATIVMMMAIPVFAGQKEDLATAYNKLQIQLEYHETKVNDLLVKIKNVELRYNAIVDAEKKAAAKKAEPKKQPKVDSGLKNKSGK